MSQFAAPKHMKCVIVKEPGGIDALQVVTRPLPTPRAGEVLIRVHAAGVNRPDIIQRLGKYPPPPGASDVLGLEVSGDIVAVGKGVRSPKVGEHVCALVSGGGYSEFTVAPAETCLSVPDALTMIEATAVPETFFTVWHNIFERGELKAGQSVLIHGGSSGIGTTAIQLAKSFGAFVVTTAGNNEKCDACRELGADLAINYNSEDFLEFVLTQTPDHGVDVVLDMVGGPYIQRNIRCLKPDGRLVNIAFLQGSKIEVDFLPLMLKRLTLTGSTLRARSVRFKGRLAKTLKDRVWPLLENGNIRPVIDTVFPLDRVADAHARMETSLHIGKIVLEVAGKSP